MPYLLLLLLLFLFALIINNTIFYIITGVITIIACYTFYQWYQSSFAPYAPTKGLKFQLPPKDLYPFKHRWFSFEIDRDDPSKITLNSVKDPTNTTLSCIHYIDESPDTSDSSSSHTLSSNITFLLCHGNPTWSFLYRKIIKILSKKYRCVSIDCPGFGLSTAPGDYSFTSEQHSYIITAVCKKLSLNNLILVQQDWGGPTGFFFATNKNIINEPDNININININIIGFVIGNTWCWNINKLERWDVYLFSKVYGGILGRILGFGDNFVIKSFWFKGFYKLMDNRVRYWYNKPFESKYSRKGTWIWPNQIFDKRCNKLLKQTEIKMIELYGNKVPCLLCWGIKDPAFIEKVELKKWKKMFINHKVVKLNNASHFWQEDEGDEAAKHILEWINEQF